MSALPIVSSALHDTIAKTPAVTVRKSIDESLMEDTIDDLRRSVRLGLYVHFGDGSPALPARDVIMAAVAGVTEAEEVLSIAMQASDGRAAHALPAWQAFYETALRLCARELVDRIHDGQRIRFDPK